MAEYKREFEYYQDDANAASDELQAKLADALATGQRISDDLTKTREDRDAALGALRECKLALDHELMFCKPPVHRCRDSDGHAAVERARSLLK